MFYITGDTHGNYDIDKLVYGENENGQTIK